MGMKKKVARFTWLLSLLIPDYLIHPTKHRSAFATAYYKLFVRKP